MGKSKMAPKKSAKKTAPKKVATKKSPTKKPAAKKSGEKKAKKKKDPNAPKKPAQGFMLFSKINRPALVKKNPSWGFGEFGKELGKQWKALDEKTQTSWKDGGALYKKHSA